MAQRPASMVASMPSFDPSVASMSSFDPSDDEEYDPSSDDEPSGVGASPPTPPASFGISSPQENLRQSSIDLKEEQQLRENLRAAEKALSK
eukprot:3572746-Rhodomonas_salina.2